MHDLTKSLLEPLNKAPLIHDDEERPHTVFRVEGPKGEGPYQWTSGGVSEIAAQANPNNSPVPYDDFPFKEWMGRPYPEMQKFKFAFPSTEAAKKWFGDDLLARMAKRGFKLRPVPAKKVYISSSGKQVIFLPHDSYEPGREPPKEKRPPKMKTAADARQMKFDFDKSEIDPDGGSTVFAVYGPNDELVHPLTASLLCRGEGEVLDKSELHPFTEEILAKAEPLAKNKPTPRFPGLGFPDDRRETPIIPRDSLAHKVKARAMGVGISRDPSTRDQINAMGDAYRQAGIANSTQAGREMARKERVDAFADDITGVKGLSTMGMAGRSEEGATPSFAVSGGRRDVKSPVGTKLHEDLHQMFGRIGDRFGLPGRVVVSMHAINTMPRNAASVIASFKQSRAGPDKGPMDAEEHIAHMLNYLNSPSDRQRFHDGIRMGAADRGIELDPNFERKLDSAMKAAYKHVVGFANSLTPRDMEDLMDQYGVPREMRKEEKMHPLTQAILQKNERPAITLAPLTKSLLERNTLSKSTVVGSEPPPPPPVQTENGELNHPAVSGGHVAIFSAEDPKFPVAPGVTPGDNASLARDLTLAGMKYEPSTGQYDKFERGFTVHNPNVALMRQLGKKYGQESIVVSKGGKNALIYTSGDNVGKANAGEGLTIHPQPPDDYYTTLMVNGKPLHFTYDVGIDKDPIPLDTILGAVS